MLFLAWHRLLWLFFSFLYDDVSIHWNIDIVLLIVEAYCPTRLVNAFLLRLCGSGRYSFLGLSLLRFSLAFFSETFPFSSVGWKEENLSLRASACKD